MNQPIDNNDNDPTLDRLLQQAFASRDGSDSRASLHDVRQRARRHQRRRAGAMVGAAAIVGAGGVAVLTRDGNDATTTAGDVGATSTTSGSVAVTAPCFLGIDQPVDTTVLIGGREPDTTSFQSEATTTTFDPSGTSPGARDTAFSVAPSGSTSTLPPDGVPPEAFATTTWPDGTPMPSDCFPAGTFRCTGNVGTDDQGYTYYEFCEPANGGWPAYPTTTVDPSNFGGIVIVDSSGGLDGAANDMVDRLEGTGLGVILVVDGTRTVDRTVLMATGDGSGLDIVIQLTDVDRLDSWSPDLIDGPLPAGTLAIVVIGQDYWTRTAPSGTTLPPDATIEPTLGTTTTTTG